MSSAPITKCRICGSKDLDSVISLGDQYVTNFVDTETKDIVKSPLELVLCKNPDCGLLQLRVPVPPEAMYSQYWYQSGISTTMVKALGDIVHSAEKLVHLNAGDIVVDIGANDGTLLAQYKEKGLMTVGFEPSNLYKLAVPKATKIINDFFNNDAFLREMGDGKAKVITSIAMFYDLPDPNRFVQDIDKCLVPGGLWIIQMNYLGLMIENNTYDNISHEHLEYYSFYTLEKLLERNGMEAFDVELNDVNGGSFRIYVRRKGDKTKNFPGAAKRLAVLRTKEEKSGLTKEETYREYHKQIAGSKNELMSFMRTEIAKGKKFYIYGASTRGLVVLQYCGIDSDIVKAATDKNRDKWGKQIVGTGIPIIPIDQYRREKPDYLLVLPYHFLDEIAEQESEFIRDGGKLVVAIPKFKTVG
jgi:NDP-4-keto-2,6-dideoxyhexose 3-C-methyltransferase